ncbi:MAG: tetratricopeptide repeat protein [Sandaracinaceae bacterium]
MAKDDRDEQETETEEQATSEEEETESSDGEAREDSDVEGSDEADSDADDSDDDDADDDDADDDDADDDDADDDDADDADDADDDDADDADDGDADDGDADDGDADDDDADDDDADDGDADDEGAAASTGPRKARRRGKTGKKDRMSAGARLAAARAAKAARKAAKRGKEKQEEQAPLDAVKESDLGQKAAQAGEWAQQNQTIVYAIAAAVILGLGGYIGWHYHSKGQAEASATLLAEALEISTAELRGEDAPPPDEDDDAPTFTSAEARAEAALEAFEAVTTSHPDSAAAAWAYLGAGNALLELERYEDARQRFDRAIAVAGSDRTVLWRALEGKGFTHEAEEQWAEAAEVYQELSRVDDGSLDRVAQYHLGRMFLAQGEREQATETFRTLVEGLREASDDEEQQDFEFVLAQAEVRLAELDPSSAPARPALPSPGAPGAGGGAPGGPGGAGDLSQEQLQELIRRFQQQQQQGGGAPTPE